MTGNCLIAYKIVLEKLPLVMQSVHLLTDSDICVILSTCKLLQRGVLLSSSF